MSFKERSLFEFAISIIVTSSIFYLLFRNKNITEIIFFIKKAKISILCLTLLISFIEVAFLYSYRWKVILEHLGYKITLREAMFIDISCGPIADIIPFKFGEITRVLYLKRIKNASYSKAIFSVFCGYLVSLLVLFFFMILGAGVYLYKSLKVNNNFYLFSLSVKKTQEKHPIIYNKIINVLTRFFTHYAKYVYSILKDIRVVGSTVLAIGLELVVVYLLALSLNLHIPFYFILPCVPLIMILSYAPFTIVGLGVREASVLFFFMRFASDEKLLSLGILYSFVEYLFPAMIGIFFIGAFLNKLIFFPLKNMD